VLISGTDLWVNVAGDSTWGDDPYDGFADESLLIEVCALDPELGEFIGILPLSAATVAAHAIDIKKARRNA
jgi:hypothetical protein